MDSNIDEVGNWINGIIGKISFTSSVGGKSLAQEIQGVIAEMIRDRSITMKMDGDGKGWEPNSRKWKAYKQRVYGTVNIGEMTGQMLSNESLMGRLKFDDETMEMRYGIGRKARVTKKVRSKKGPHNTKAGKGARQNVATDIQKGDWFTRGCDVDKKGRRQNRPKRPFYEMDDVISEEVFDTISDFLDDLLS